MAAPSAEVGAGERAMRSLAVAHPRSSAVRSRRISQPSSRISEDISEDISPPSSRTSEDASPSVRPPARPSARMEVGVGVGAGAAVGCESIVHTRCQRRRAEASESRAEAAR